MAEVYHGPFARCSRCRHRASVRIAGQLACWEHYNAILKEATETRAEGAG